MLVIFWIFSPPPFIVQPSQKKVGTLKNVNKNLLRWFGKAFWATAWAWIQYKDKINSGSRTWIWCLQHISKLLKQEHVYHRYITFSFNNTSFESEILSYNSLIYNFSCLRVQELCCYTLCFIMLQGETGLDFRQASLVPALLKCEATVLIRAECGLAFILLE